jgi:hypothetical protein
MEPRPIADSLRSVGRDLGLPEPGIVERIVQEWGTLAGRLAPVSRPIGVRDGRLVVAAADSAVAEALGWQSSDICRRLGDHLQSDAVTRLDVRVRPRPSRDDQG